MTLSFKLFPEHRKVVLPYHAKLAAVVGGERRTLAGIDCIVADHTADLVRFMENLGTQIPPPIMHHYNWPGARVPFESQTVTAAMMTMNKRAYVLNELGTGKTFAALGAMDYLMDELEIHKALIVAPVSTLTCVWEREIFATMPHRTCALLYGDAQQRLKALSQDVDFYIVNHDGLRVKSLYAALLKRRDIDCILIDELAAYRNGQSTRWKLMSALTSTRKYVWGMTGAPTPNDPTDAFAQAKLINPKRLPVAFFKAFRDMTMRQISQFKWVPKTDANQIVHDAMQPAVRFTRAECVDLPPLLITERDPPLSKEQEAAYRDMHSNMRVKFQKDPRAIYAPNAGVQLGKLLQIGAGFVYGPDGSAILIDYSERFDALEEIIYEAEKKVIVFLPFTRGVDRLYSDLMQAGHSVAKVYGDTPKAERDRIFNAFQSQADPHVLVAHPKCMSHGLTLTAANTIVWFSPSLSRETYEQANGRVSRPGQDTHQLVVRLVSTMAERKAYRVLDRRGAVQDVLLELFAAD